MAASPLVTDGGSIPPQDHWDHQRSQDVKMHITDDAPAVNGGAAADDRRPDDASHVSGQPPPAEGTPAAESADGSAGTKNPDGTVRGEKIIKPNKVYIGGLPEHTRKEDLENCFGKIGNITNIELKVGYGFVEFDNKDAAEESVAKYHDGYFMGNKIRVELSRGGGRTAKYGGDPGACFKCGQVGHWARECPNHSPNGLTQTRPGAHPSDAPLIDRIQPPRDYAPPRDYPSYRDDYGRYPPPPRDARYYDFPPPPSRDYRRPPSPARDYRDYPVRSSRELDDYRARGVAPPTPPARFDSRSGYYPESDPLPPAAYPPRVFGAPPAREYYDRYDRRAPPPTDRYAYPPTPASGRPRSPPVVAPRSRDEYDRPPPRDYPPPPTEYRGRPASPPHARYAEYTRSGSDEPRYRRRSQSPPTRSNSGYEPGYPPASAGPVYNGSSGYAGSGYPANGSSARGGAAPRDYPPPPRSREGESAAYRRN